MNLAFTYVRVQGGCKRKGIHMPRAKLANEETELENDAQGHKFRAAAVANEESELEDAEGHRVTPDVANEEAEPEDDVEGHRGKH
jgi:hypothetical protein